MNIRYVHDGSDSDGWIKPKFTYDMIKGAKNILTLYNQFNECVDEVKLMENIFEIHDPGVLSFSIDDSKRYFVYFLDTKETCIQDPIMPYLNGIVGCNKVYTIDRKNTIVRKRDNECIVFKKVDVNFCVEGDFDVAYELSAFSCVMPAAVPFFILLKFIIDILSKFGYTYTWVIVLITILAIIYFFTSCRHA